MNNSEVDVQDSFDAYLRANTGVGWFLLLMAPVLLLFVIGGEFPSGIDFPTFSASTAVLASLAAIYFLLVGRGGTGGAAIAAVATPICVGIVLLASYVIGVRSDGPGAGADVFLGPAWVASATALSVLAQRLRWKSSTRPAA